LTPARFFRDDWKNGNNGVASFARWLGECGLALPPLPYERTPGLGFHLWLRTGGRHVQSRSGILPGVDVRGSGGYVAVYPSGIRIRSVEAHGRKARPEDYYYGQYGWAGCPCQIPLGPPGFLDALELLPGSSPNGGPGGGGGGHDGEIAATVLSDVLRGLDKEQCYAEWLKIAVPRDPGWPFTVEDFERHYRGAARKAEQIRAGEGQVDQADMAGLAALATQAPVQGVAVPRPVVISDADGLLAVKAARWVIDQGPLLNGIDNKLWAYQDGVWVLGETPLNDIVLQRIAALLGDKYRKGHGTNIKDMIHARVGPLRCDPVPDLINFTDGLLHWRESNEISAHDPAVLSTAQLAVRWNPEAKCPAFDHFLSQVLMPGDVNRMWEVIGYLMMSGNPLHKIILLYGRGFNGKGTLLRTLTAMLGESSVSSVSLASLAGNRFAPARTVGKLANICGDIDATYIEGTGLLKQISGEDPIDIEHKFRDPAPFTCWAVPVFSANEIPTSSDTSYGWQQRWEVFTFPHRFQHAPGLEAALQSPGELEGIAARGVEALRELMSRTPPEFTRTQAGDDAKAEFTAHQDPLAMWLSEGCWPQDGAWTDRRHAHAHYVAFCGNEGRKSTLGRTKFYMLMRERFTEIKQRGWDGYQGLTLHPSED
jgi:P4 family phage/plasmid primase-like protien